MALTSRTTEAARFPLSSNLQFSGWLKQDQGGNSRKAASGGKQLDPRNAGITAHLGQRLADQALKQGGDPDEARRIRGEAVFLTSRALELALKTRKLRSCAKR